MTTALVFERTPFGTVVINSGRNEAYFQRDDLCAPIEKNGIFTHPFRGEIFKLIGDDLFLEITRWERLL